ncbi:IS66 family insertion sequence element accessory protein TnpA [Cupriavidus necator]
MLAQWRKTGLSIRAFCHQHGLVVSIVGPWRKRVDHDRPGCR